MKNFATSEATQPISPAKMSLAIMYALILLAIVVISHFFVQKKESTLIDQFRSILNIEGGFNNLLSNLQDAETGQRGYLLTLNDEYLEPYTLAVGSNAIIFKAIEKELDNDPFTIRNFQKLKQLSKDKLDELNTTIQFSQNDHYREAMELVNTDIGKLKMDSIRLIINALRKQQEDFLIVKTTELNRLQQVSRAVVAISAVIITSIFLYIFLFVRPLFEKVKKRNLEIAKNQKLLEIKNNDLEHFAFITSHDLKEPSRTICGYIDAFEEDYADEFDINAQKYLQYIKEASQRMNNMISSILSFSNIGKHEPFTKLDLNDTIREVNQGIRRLKNESNTSIDSPNLPTIIGKDPLIKLLFQNLITNAIKFRKKGLSPIIKISFIEKPDLWEFYVTDNGIGIPAKHQGSIFNFFTKLHSSTVYEGQGIGLAFCKKIVEIHKGNISVASTSEKGSTFKFTILKRLSN